MAEGFLKSIGPELKVYSAGTNPAKQVNPNAIKVMNEVDIDISNAYSKDVNNFLNESFDYVVTVCDNAKEVCPVFNGSVKNKIHLGFIDPAEAEGTDEEILNVYRDVRDEIKDSFNQLYHLLKNN